MHKLISPVIELACVNGCKQQKMIRSPITAEPVILYSTMPVGPLIARYESDLGIDVRDVFEGLQVLRIYACPSTGYRFYYPPSVAGEGAFYDRLHAGQHLEAEDSEAREDWDFAIERIGSDDKVLDVGCSTGSFLERVKSSSRTGIDGSREGVKIAAARGLNVLHSTAQEFAEHNMQAFDVVCAFQILEHVDEVRSFLAALGKLVRPGGALIISVPNSDPYYAGWAKFEPLNCPPHHIGLWSHTSLSAVAAQLGLKVTETRFYGQPDGFALRVYRRAAYLTGVWRRPGSLHLSDWARVLLATPPAALLTAWEFLSRPTSRYPYMVVALTC